MVSGAAAPAVRSWSLPLWKRRRLWFGLVRFTSAARAFECSKVRFLHYSGRALFGRIGRHAFVAWAGE